MQPCVLLTKFWGAWAYNGRWRHISAFLFTCCDKLPVQSILLQKNTAAPHVFSIHCFAGVDSLTWRHRPLKYPFIPSLHIRGQGLKMVQNLYYWMPQNTRITKVFLCSSYVFLPHCSSKTKKTLGLKTKIKSIT